jgi:glutamine cyclotransferase
MQIGGFHTGLSDGWGLTNDGRYLIVSDSSHNIYWVAPDTFQTVKRVVVKDGDHELPWLNEVRKRQK